MTVVALVRNGTRLTRARAKVVLPEPDGPAMRRIVPDTEAPSAQLLVYLSNIELVYDKSKLNGMQGGHSF